jgi:hypothetical protein
MAKNYFTLPVIVLGLFMMMSCALGPTSLEENWGRAYTLQKESQILNPDAGRNVTPVSGLDGKTGEKILDTYRKGAQETTPSKVGVLTITQ